MEAKDKQDISKSRKKCEPLPTQTRSKTCQAIVVAQVVEHHTKDWKDMGSNPGRKGMAEKSNCLHMESQDFSTDVNRQ